MMLLRLRCGRERALRETLTARRCWALFGPFRKILKISAERPIRHEWSRMRGWPPTGNGWGSRASSQTRLMLSGFAHSGTASARARSAIGLSVSSNITSTGNLSSFSASI